MPPQNYRREVEQVYAGGAPSPAHLQELKDKNINKILSLDAGIASNIKPYVKSLGMVQIVIPITLSSQIGDNIKYLKNKIKEIISNNQPIYVHCSDGANRTGFVIAMYKILKNLATPLQAIKSQQKWKYGQNLDLNTKRNWNGFLYSLKMKPTSSPIKIDVSSADDAPYQHDITSLLKDIYRINDITPAFSTLPSFAPRADIPYLANDPNIFDELEEDDFEVESVPQIGQYSNMAQTRGAGAVEGAGPLNIFQY